MSDCRETLPLKKGYTLALSEKLTKERFAGRNQLKAKARKRYPVCFPIPVHRKLTLDHLLEPLAKFLGHELGEKPYPPPGNLGSLIKQLEPIELAVITLTPLLNGIMHDWDADDPAEAERSCAKELASTYMVSLGLRSC